MFFVSLGSTSQATSNRWKPYAARVNTIKKYSASLPQGPGNQQARRLQSSKRSPNRCTTIHGCWTKNRGGILPPQNHPFVHRVWNHYFHHPFWGFYPYFWFNTHMTLLQNGLRMDHVCKDEVSRWQCNLSICQSVTLTPMHPCSTCKHEHKWRAYQLILSSEFSQTHEQW